MYPPPPLIASVRRQSNTPMHTALCHEAERPLHSDIGLTSKDIDAALLLPVFVALLTKQRFITFERPQPSQNGFAIEDNVL